MRQAIDFLTILQMVGLFYGVVLTVIVVMCVGAYVYDLIYERGWRRGFDEARRLYTWVEDYVPDAFDSARPGDPR